MNSFRRLLALSLLALACLGGRAEPPLPPTPTRWATDRAGYIRESTRARLDAELQAYEKTSHHQVILWIGDSLQGEPIEDFAARAMKAWGIGRKQEKDGVVLFVFAKDRKLRIEVGYGLEDRLPDAIANRIIQLRMAPRLKAGDPDGAMEQGIHTILAALGQGPLSPESPTGGTQTGEAQAPPTPPEPGQEPLSSQDSVGGRVLHFLGCLPLAFFLLILASIIFRVRRRGGGTTLGGGSSRSSNWDSDSDSGSSSSSSDDSDFSSGGGDSGGGGASGDW